MTKNNGTLDNLAEGCGCGIISGFLALVAIVGVVEVAWDGVRSLFS